MKKPRIFTAILALLTLFTLGLYGCGSSYDVSDEPQSYAHVSETAQSSADEFSHDSTPQPTHDESSDVPTSQPDTSSSARVLVAYFSATGTTRRIAKDLASLTGADIYEITPKVPYTADDLRYYSDCRADREQSDPTARPEIGGDDIDVGGYDTIILGYPIWHGQAPKIIYTFLEGHDLSGKRIIPFCTSGSSPVGSSVQNLRQTAPAASWHTGTRFDGDVSEDELREWLNALLPAENKTEENTMYIYANGSRLEIELSDNSSAAAFAARLAEGDVTVKMNDYGDFEKVGSLGFSLPRNDSQITTSPGDVILYQGNQITVYYDQNSWSFTRLGKIKGQTRQSMLEFFGGKGEVEVRFSLK